MPEKDGSDDKKSTKSVVNKKQKQLMNKEQLDLSNVAESFGGEIVGEPVELDEFAFTGTALGGIALWKILAGLAGAGAIYQGGKVINKELERRREKEYIDNWAKGDDVINPGALDTKKDGDVKVSNNKDLVVPGSTTLNPAKVNTRIDANTIAKTKTNTKTRRLPKPFRMNLPKIPGTPHNVGRRVNPQ